LLQLRRITSGASWIPQIDGLRFVAIMGVLLFHARGEVQNRGLQLIALPPSADWLDRLILGGDRGVPLFFVVSGFILARPFLRQHRLGGRPVQLGAYFKRRITRLELPYALSLLIDTVAIVAAFHIALRKLLPHLLISMLYLHRPVYARDSDINFITWTLEVEVQFYILMPLLANLFRISSTTWRRGAIGLLMIAWAALTWQSTPWMRFSIMEQMQYFLAGLLLADLLEYPRYSNHESWSWDIVSLLGWPIIFLVPHTRFTLGFLPLLIIPVCIAAFRGKASNWFFRQPVIAITGGMCYSIYLMHMLLISISFRLIKHLWLPSIGATFALQMVLLTAAVLLGSTVYYVLIERPCMDPNWPGKLAARMRRIVRVSPQAVTGQ
jgi:peptidoglycan/LPS O-acetylase OafA/YrhL